jgi:hypothetical protein
MFDKEVSRSFQKAESGALARAAPTETLEQARNHHTLAETQTLKGRTGTNLQQVPHRTLTLMTCWQAMQTARRQG